jgi:hypothetical protein
MGIYSLDRIAERFFDGRDHPRHQHYMIDDTTLCVLRDPKWCLAGTVYRTLKLSPKITCPACVTFFHDHRRVIGEEQR